MPDSAKSLQSASPPSILRVALAERDCHGPSFTDEKVEAWKVKRFALPSSPSEVVVLAVCILLPLLFKMFFLALHTDSHLQLFYSQGRGVIFKAALRQKDKWYSLSSSD